MAGDDHSARERTAEVLRSFLRILLTPGLNLDIDAICRDRLGLAATQASIGFHRSGLGSQQLRETILTLYDSGIRQAPWLYRGILRARGVFLGKCRPPGR